MKDVTSHKSLRPILDSENPNSIVARIEGEAFENAIKRVPVNYWALDESELKKMAKPTMTDFALRVALWNEIRLSHRHDNKIKASRLYEGICTAQHWYHNVLASTEKVAWLLSPLRDYEQSLEPLLSVIAERCHEFINLNVYDKDGRPNPALIKLVLKTSEMVEGRLRGGAIQRSETKNVNLNFNSVDHATKTEAEAQAALLPLEERIKFLKTLPRKLQLELLHTLPPEFHDDIKYIRL